MTDSSTSPHGWIVLLDGEGCTLCEACARDCPTGAIRLERSEETLSLFFDPSLCNACPDGDSCQAICPENAIRLVEILEGAGDAEESLLISSPLLRCASCGKDFAAAQKVDALSRKDRTHHRMIRDLCPICRRTQLVVSFIQEHRAPGSKAEYRSTTEILRKAGKLRDDSE
jgi:ferredoxin